MTKACHIVYAQTNAGSSLYLVNRALENATAGNRVLFVNVENSLENVRSRFCAYPSFAGAQKNIRIVTCINLEEFSNLLDNSNVGEAGHLFDTIIIDGVSLWIKPPNMVEQLHKLVEKVTAHCALVVKLQMSRAGFGDPEIAKRDIEKMVEGLACTASVLQKEGDIISETFVCFNGYTTETTGQMWFIETESGVPRLEVFGEQLTQ